MCGYPSKSLKASGLVVRGYLSYSLKEWSNEYIFVFLDYKSDFGQSGSSGVLLTPQRCEVSLVRFLKLTNIE